MVIRSLLAVTEANNAGYDEAILLTGEGTVADGSGENIFVVRDGVIYTPDLATGRFQFDDGRSLRRFLLLRLVGRRP